MKKTIICLLAALCIVLCLTSCGIIQTPNGPSKEVINFDLSQYKDHGKLSCGLIWVTQEVSDYNKEAEMKFAYLDVDGNVKSPWFSLDKYRAAENFINGYIILIERAEFKEKYGTYSDYVVYNTKFQKLASSNCYIGALNHTYISDFDAQGYAYAVGYDKQTKQSALFWINISGVHKFDGSSSGGVDEYDLAKFKESNGYFVLVSGSSDPNYLYTKIAQIYNKQSRLVLDIEKAMKKNVDECAITSAEVLENNVVKVYFYGMSKKLYVCTMDFSGKFVESPKEA